MSPCLTKTVRPHLERVLESFIVMVQRGRGQPVESLLIGGEVSRSQHH